MDTEPVRIDKDVMNKLRKHITEDATDGKVYGKISDTVEKAIKEYLDKYPKENFAKQLKDWMSDTNVDIIDDVLEFLLDSDCLNDKGKDLRKEFWEKYIKR